MVGEDSTPSESSALGAGRMPPWAVHPAAEQESSVLGLDVSGLGEEADVAAVTGNRRHTNLIPEASTRGSM
jgi:hypothetical protein